MAGSGHLSRVIRVDLAYDGSEFSGYARQPGLRTVQGVLEAALDQMLGGEFTTSVAGRTDAGVHAAGQVVSVRTESSRATEKIAKSLAKMLPGDLVATSVSEAGDGFDARRSARSRRYRYRVLTTDLPDPTRRHLTWWTGPLDLSVLEEAAARLIGTHEFAAFCKKPADDEATVRSVSSANWRRPEGEGAEGEVWFEVEAPSFLHQMVRRMVGWSVACATGRSVLTAPDDMERLGCKPAPPGGLTLLGVAYMADDDLERRVVEADPTG